MTPAGDIPGEGKTYSLTLTGILPDEGVDVRASSGGTALVTGKVTASGTAVELAVPGNGSYSSRSVTFEYQWNGTWTLIGASRTQQGRYVTAVNISNNSISGDGESIAVSFTGWGGFKTRAICDGKTIAQNLSYTDQQNYTSRLNIPANTTGSIRSVTFEYEYDGSWRTIKTISQDRQPKSVGRYYSVQACEDKCKNLGGIPTLNQAKSLSWDGWKGYEDFYVLPKNENGQCRYTRNGDWYASSGGYGGGNIWVGGSSTDGTSGCRCLNE